MRQRVLNLLYSPRLGRGVLQRTFLSDGRYAVFIADEYGMREALLELKACGFIEDFAYIVNGQQPYFVVKYCQRLRLAYLSKKGKQEKRR